MRVVLTQRFEQDFRSLSVKSQTHVTLVIERLPAAIGAIHLHQGISIRKLHHSRIYEARAGLSLRIVFAVRHHQLILHRVGTHDMVRQYLKAL